jgi:hypothetical protein
VSTDYLEFNKGAAQTDIAPGTYLVTLTEIGEPKTNIAKQGPNAGSEFTVRDWTFVTEDDVEITDSASVSKSPRSKSYQWVTALLGGSPAPIGERLDFSQLIGREAIATIELNEAGWPKIATLSAKPKARAARPTAAPEPAVRRSPGAAPADDLPF